MNKPKPHDFKTSDKLDVARIFQGDDLRALFALQSIYGDDVDALLNALHSLSARIGIAAEADPKAFAEGMRYHWQSVVDHLEECRRKETH